MQANALLNNRRKSTISDLYLYDLVHPLFLESMGELGAENLVLSLVRKHPDRPDRELIEKSKLSRRTFYRHKKTLQERGQI